MQQVGGPSPTDLLRQVAQSAPWFLVLARATPEEKLTALGKLKRQLDHTSDDQELVHGVANHDPIAAFLLQQRGLGASSANNKAVEVYVHSKVPTIKFKDLLLPPRGSMERARCHFKECMNSQDKVVRALAAERDFLCNFVERQFIPVPKRGQPLGHVEVPRNALHMLRNTFKSLSHRIKKASARNDNDLALIRAWYGDHLIVANTWCQQELADATLSLVNADNMSSRRALPPQLSDVVPPQPKRQKTQADKKKKKPFAPHSIAAVETNPDLDVVTLKSTTDKKFQVPKYAASWFAPGVDRNKALSIFKANGSTGGVAFRAAFREICRNCWFAGRGPVSHSIKACRELGNQCAMPCPRCGQYHWINDCKR